MAITHQVEELASGRRSMVTNDGAQLSVIDVGQGRPLTRSTTVNCLRRPRSGVSP